MSDVCSERESRNIFTLICEELFGEKFRHFELHSDYSPEAKSLRRLEGFIEGLRRGLPIQHVLGHTWFDDMKILTPPGALIPRPETEEMLFHLREAFTGKQKKPLRALDLGTGTGCIALSLKRQFPDCEVFAADKSPEALRIARQNAESLGLDISFRQSDILYLPPDKLIPEGSDLIVSNPPYIPESEADRMDRRVTDHDPALALFVPDEEPLLFYKKIIDAAAAELLRPSAELWLECHEDYARDTAAYAKENGFKEVSVIQDLQGKERFVRAQTKDE